MEKDHLEILLEDVNDKFALVLEGHEGLRNEIRRSEERLSEKIDVNRIRIEALDEKLSNRIDSLEKNLGARLEAMATNLDVHRRDTELHRGYQVSEASPARK